MVRYRLLGLALLVSALAPVIVQVVTLAGGYALDSLYPSQYCNQESLSLEIMRNCCEKCFCDPPFSRSFLSEAPSLALFCNGLLTLAGLAAIVVLTIGKAFPKILPMNNLSLTCAVLCWFTFALFRYWFDGIVFGSSSTLYNYIIDEHHPALREICRSIGDAHLK